MKSCIIVLPFLAAISFACSAQASAQDASPTTAPIPQPLRADFSQFVPRPSQNLVLDFTLWDDALRFMVLRMGPSTRQGAPSIAPRTGSRFVWGHDSRFRLEGNRIPFSMLSQKVIDPLTEYRLDLERIGSELDIATLPRNEQLAFWINLHNVSVIEKIALNYPVTSPTRIRLGEDRTPLDETRFIVVGGIAMSPKDIRTQIVFPNWPDAKLIYGFFRGEVGGPTIPRYAYTGENLDDLLTQNGTEFVNSLRGVESIRGKLLVSEIYEEAAPFYFPDMAADLRSHLSTLAQEEVQELLSKPMPIKVNDYEDTVADLAGGESEPLLTALVSNDQYPGLEVSPSMARLMGERNQKFRTLIKQGKVGRVLVLPNPGETLEPAEEIAPTPAPE